MRENSRTGLSGVQKGQRHLDRFKQVLTELVHLPSRNGRVNMTALAAACGFDRQVLYKNPGVRAHLEAAALNQTLCIPESRHSTERSGDADDARLQARILQLEQRAVALGAENAELRRRLRQYEHIEEHLLETGRRIKL